MNLQSDNMFLKYLVAFSCALVFFGGICYAKLTTSEPEPQVVTAYIPGSQAIPECVDSKQYQPTWESLDSRPLPQWYDDAKVGQ